VNNSGIRRNQRASGEIKGHPAKSKGIRRNQRASGEIKGHPAGSELERLRRHPELPADPGTVRWTVFKKFLTAVDWQRFTDGGVFVAF